MSLRAILSGSRVKKRTAPASKKRSAAGSRSASSTPPWPTGLRLTKPGGSHSGTKDLQEDDDEEEREDFFEDGEDDKLDDSGVIASLASDLELRDVVQALRYARANMFDPMPRTDGLAGGAGGSGSTFVGNSTRIAELLNLRRRLPPLATTAHIAALLPNATATERETVALVRAGTLRKVVQPQWRRGGAASGGGSARSSSSSSSKSGDRALIVGSESLGEVLVETAALVQMVRDGPASMSDATKAAFSAWLTSRDDDAAAAAAAAAAATAPITIGGCPASQLTVGMADELVRAGFLVSRGAAGGLCSSSNIHVAGGHRSAHLGSGRGSGQSDTGDVFARPEDRTTLLSLETVAKAASGSFAAVGGAGAVYTAGGGGARSGATPRTPQTGAEDLVLAIPGHGTFVKLVSAALAHLLSLLVHRPFREALETTLRERWDAGGGGGGGGGGAAGRGRYRAARSGCKRVPLSRTKKWKDFCGLSFDWVLAEALGAGLVELFDTGSVGRGVRLV